MYGLKHTISNLILMQVAMILTAPAWVMAATAGTQLCMRWGMLLALAILLMVEVPLVLSYQTQKITCEHQ